MKKAIYYGIRDVRVEDVPDLRPGRGEVKVRIKYCGICGSDLHEYLHGPFPQSPFGHEACGVISEVGLGVDNYQPGDRVCAIFPGSYAESVICPIERLIAIPPHMSWERAAVLEPFSGAAYAISRGNIQERDSVFIAGAGTVGLMLLLGLKALGVKTIYMTDVLLFRREKAKELGATEVWDPTVIKVPAQVKAMTGGKGVDAAVEAVGIEASLKDCLASVRYRGTVVVQGIFTDRALIHMLGFVTRETTMIGTNSIFPQLALEWLERGNIAPEAVITHIIPLTAIDSQGFALLASHPGETIKILVAP